MQLLVIHFELSTVYTCSFLHDCFFSLSLSLRFKPGMPTAGQVTQPKESLDLRPSEHEASLASHSNATRTTTNIRLLNEQVYVSVSGLKSGDFTMLQISPDTKPTSGDICSGRIWWDPVLGQVSTTMIPGLRCTRRVYRCSTPGCEKPVKHCKTTQKAWALPGKSMELVCKQPTPANAT